MTEEPRFTVVADNIPARWYEPWSVVRDGSTEPLATFSDARRAREYAGYLNRRAADARAYDRLGREEGTE